MNKSQYVSKVFKIAGKNLARNRNLVELVEDCYHAGDTVAAAAAMVKQIANGKPVAYAS